MNDGDKGLVVQDEIIINVAKRDCEGVVPLYYEMLKAKDKPLTNERIYTALTSAYKANIGIISNEITKIWNTPNPNVDAVKWLCMYNNFVIDYAKTLFLPEKPSHVDEELKKFSKMKLPHFFKYAKDKEDKQVSSINMSTVNMLEDIIPDKPIQFKDVSGVYNYKNLMKNSRTVLNKEIVSLFINLNKNKKFYMQTEDINNIGFFQFVKDKMNEISDSDSYITDNLILYLHNKNSRSKDTLWNCYGDIIYENLLLNIGNTICCERCRERVGKLTRNQLYCSECGAEINRMKALESYNKKKLLF